MRLPHQLGPLPTLQRKPEGVGETGMTRPRPVPVPEGPPDAFMGTAEGLARGSRPTAGRRGRRASTDHGALATDAARPIAGERGRPGLHPTFHAPPPGEEKR